LNEYHLNFQQAPGISKEATRVARVCKLKEEMQKLVFVGKEPEVLFLSVVAASEGNVRNKNGSVKEEDSVPLCMYHEEGQSQACGAFQVLSQLNFGHCGAPRMMP